MRIIIVVFLGVAGLFLQAQTMIPNPGFENWTTGSNYSDPVGWDTPNQELMAIPFFGITVVSKSTDHYGAGAYSAKLETKNYLFGGIDVPGFMTCGNFMVDLITGIYTLSGGVPVTDFPTHLKGYYKYIPKGGDSCVIGIGLTKTSGGVQDTIGMGYFSTKDTVADWTPFSAWIDYISTEAPDTMNIIAMSTAQEIMTVGTTLYVDELFLDYTVGYNASDPAAGIRVYNDLETRRLMVFLDFPKPEFTRMKLFDMKGREISSVPGSFITNDRLSISYSFLKPGVYLLQIVHDHLVFTRKFFLNH